MTRDGGGTLDIRKRTAVAYESFNRLNKIWSARGISRKTKTILFKTLVLSVLLYACETRKLTKGEEKKLDTFHTKYLRRMFRIRWQKHVKKGTAGDGRSRSNKREGEKEEMVLDWTCPEERSEQGLCCGP